MKLAYAGMGLAVLLSSMISPAFAESAPTKDEFKAAYIAGAINAEGRTADLNIDESLFCQRCQIQVSVNDLRTSNTDFATSTDRHTSTVVVQQKHTHTGYGPTNRNAGKIITFVEPVHGAPDGGFRRTVFVVKLAVWQRSEVLVDDLPVAGFSGNDHRLQGCQLLVSGMGEDHAIQRRQTKCM